MARFTAPRAWPRWVCLALMLGCTGVLPMHSSAASPDRAYAEQLTQQREQYRDALAVLARGDRNGFRRLADGLRDYPLYPYLEYTELLRYISRYSRADMESFRQRYADTPLSDRLYYHWLQSLARKREWKAYLNSYEPGLSARYDCYYYWAQYKEGRHTEAFAGARRLWLVGKSQDDACNPLFDVWRARGDLTSDLAWERVQLAMDNNAVQLSRYLERYLEGDQKRLAQLWRSTVRRPEQLTDMDQYLSLRHEALPMLLAGFKRLIRRDPDLALALWPEYEARFLFDHQALKELYQYAARNLAVNYRPDAEYWLTQAVTLGDYQDLISYGIRHALREQNWQRARVWLALLHRAEYGSGQWRYWQAIAQREIALHQSVLRPSQALPAPAFPGPLRDVQQANPPPLMTVHQQIQTALHHRDRFTELLPAAARAKLDPEQPPVELLSDLANERSFYGFLASERLGRPLALNSTARRTDQRALEAMAQHPGIVRARELHLLGEELDARREWYFALSSFNDEQRSLAAQLAHLWGWHHQAIIAASQSTIHDQLDLRFPVAYQDSVSEQAGKTGLESEWILSLIRQESAFAPDARSPAGALGVMQLMPGTARQVSRQLGIPYRWHSLLDPAHNIQLGSHYLAGLYDEFGHNAVVATAAYNAGPHRARRWLPEDSPMRSDVWIETIPFRETRNYVKNVLTYKAIYREHLGLDARLSSLPALIPPLSTLQSAQ